MKRELLAYLLKRPLFSNASPSASRRSATTSVVYDPELSGIRIAWTRQGKQLGIGGGRYCQGWGRRTIRSNGAASRPGAVSAEEQKVQAECRVDWIILRRRICLVCAGNRTAWQKVRAVLTRQKLNFRPVAEAADGPIKANVLPSMQRIKVRPMAKYNRSADLLPGSPFLMGDQPPLIDNGMPMISAGLLSSLSRK